MLPFSHEQFLAVFAEYNTSIWPAQLFAYAIGIAICAALVFRIHGRELWVAAGLAVLWAWTGAVYHIAFFAPINRPAVAFGMVFMLQGVLLLVAGATGRMQFGAGQKASARSFAGWAFMLYAAVLYPAIGMASGMVYPGLPVFGVSPCPVTLFTWGVFLTASAVPWWLLAIPFAWSIVGGSAAFLLHVPQDWLLLASCLVAFAVRRNISSSPRR